MSNNDSRPFGITRSTLDRLDKDLVEDVAEKQCTA
jgi:hypothetical protein